MASITLELTERQSNIIFSAIGLLIEKLSIGSIDELMEMAEHEHVLMELIKEELTQDQGFITGSERVPELLEIGQKIHHPFCPPHHKSHLN